MSFLQAMQNISPLVVLFNLVAFFVALLLIVFVHEFGHYIVARWCGVKSEVFSVGFGKELFGTLPPTLVVAYDAYNRTTVVFKSNQPEFAEV